MTDLFNHGAPAIAWERPDLGRTADGRVIRIEATGILGGFIATVPLLGGGDTRRSRRTIEAAQAAAAEALGDCQ